MVSKCEVVIVRVGQPPVITTIENSLSAMQRIVGGYIETVHVQRGIMIICNEDGVAENLPHNGCGILGDFFFIGVNSEGENVSLSPKECRAVVDYVEKYRDVRHPNLR